MTLIRFLTLAVLPFWMFPAHAQPWTGILDSSRAIDWQATNPGAANINESRTQCGATLLPSGVDDTVAINNAIASCGEHRYVLLGEGTFIVSRGITFGSATVPVHNVTLRGSSPTQTIIRFTGPNYCLGINSDICIVNAAGVAGWHSGDTNILPGGTNAANWTAGYAQGTTQITLDNVSGLTASSGSAVYTLILDQPNDEAGIVNTPGGATESENTVTIHTIHPHGFEVGQSVYVDNVGLVNIASPADGGRSEIGTTVTIKTVAPHGFAVGNTVCVSGSDGYGGPHAITAVPTTSTFTYELVTAGLPRGGYGTVDTCYNNSGSSQPAYTITAVPSPTTFTYTSALRGLANSGASTTFPYPATAAVELGGPMVCLTGRICRAAAEGQGTQGRLSGNTYYSQQQHVKIVGVSGQTVTISPGLYRSNWGANGKTVVNGRSPGAWWRGPAVTGDAIENITLDHTASSNMRVGIWFDGAYNCWVKNVRSINSNEAHIRMQLAAHNTITSSYFYGTQTAHSNAYGVEERESGDDLIINNMFQHMPNPTLIGSTSGTVVAYNFSTDDFYNQSPWMTPGSQFHDSGDYYVLVEGNQWPSMKADYVHGTHVLDTLFRNHLPGTDINSFNGPAQANTSTGTIPIHMFGKSNYFNLIGNVLGTSGWQTVYESSPLTDPTGNLFNVNRAIYGIGWGSTQDACTLTLCDPIAYQSLMRWGNYDTVSGTAKWNAAEVPSTISSYANPIPATQSLPASLFLSSQPAFWTTPFGTPPWPAIGPDVTGGPGPGGHSYDIPAKRCYQNTPIDTAYQGAPISITGASWSSNKATITFPGAGSLIGTAIITVAGVTPSGYNGTFGINGQTTTGISFATASPGVYSSGGTVTYTPNILQFDAAACYPSN